MATDKENWKDNKTSDYSALTQIIFSVSAIMIISIIFISCLRSPEAYGNGAISSDWIVAVLALMSAMLWVISAFSSDRTWNFNAGVYSAVAVLAQTSDKASELPAQFELLKTKWPVYVFGACGLLIAIAAIGTFSGYVRTSKAKEAQTCANS